MADVQVSLSVVAENSSSLDTLVRGLQSVRTQLTDLQTKMGQGLPVNIGPAVASYEELRGQVGQATKTLVENALALKGLGTTSATTAASMDKLISQALAQEAALNADAAALEKTIGSLQAFVTASEEAANVGKQLTLSLDGVTGSFEGMATAATASQEEVQAALTATALRAQETWAALRGTQMTLPGMTAGAIATGGMGGAAGAAGAVGYGAAAMRADMNEVGSNLRNFGRSVVSVGYSTTISAGILDASLMMAAGQAANLDDSIQRAVTAASGTPEQLDKLRNDIKQIGMTSTAPLRDTIAGAYNFYSSLPPQLKLIDDQHRQWANQMFENNLKLKVIGDGLNMSTPIEKVMLNMNAALSQFFPGASPDQLPVLADRVRDTFTNAMLHTSTEIGLFGDSLRIIGPMAHQMGMSFQQTAELLAVLAEFKVRGAPAGQSLKRIFSREIAPTGAAARDESELRSEGVDISLFDQTTGKLKNFYEVLDNINKVLSTKTDADKGKIIKDIAGLWAIPQLGALLSHEKAVGVSGMQQEATAFTQPGSTDQAYAQRAADLKQQMQKTLNELEVEGLKTVQAMAPGLISLLQHIQHLIEAFDRLSPGVKKFIGDALLGSAAALTLAGPLEILFGSFIKIIGTVLKMPFGFEKMSSSIGSFLGGEGNTLGAWLGRVPGLFLGVARAIPFVGTAIELLSGPIGWAIAAVGLVLTAWNRDWLHIREGVENFTKYMNGQFLEQIGKSLDDFIHFLKDTLAKVEAWGSGMISSLETSAKKMWDGFIKSSEDTFDHGWTTFADHAKTTMENWAMNIADWFLGHPIEIAYDLKFIKHGVQAGFNNEERARVSEAARQHMAQSDVMRMHGPSYSSMYPGAAGQSANSLFENGDQAMQQAAGAMPDTALENANKKTKAQADAIINIGNINADRIVAAAHQMALKILAAGGKIKDAYVDLVSAGGQVTRVYGNQKLLEEATKAFKDHSVQQAEALLRRAEEYHNSLLQTFQKLQKFEQSMGNPNDRAVVNALLANIAYKMEQAATRDTKAAGGEVTRTQGFDARFQSDLQNYQARLTALTNMRKNNELPTLQDLNREYLLELNYKDKLTADLDKETSSRDALQAKLAQAKTAVQALSDAGLTNSQAFKDASAKVAEYQDALDTLNTSIMTGQGELAQLNNTLDQTQQRMLQAGQAATKFKMDLIASLTAGMKAGLDGIFGEFESSLDNLMKRLFVGSGTISTFIRDAFKGAISNALQIISGGLTDNFQTWISKAMGIGTRENPEAKKLLEAAQAHITAAHEVLRIHATVIHNAHIHAARQLGTSADRLVQAANAIVAAAGGGPGSGFGTPYNVAMGGGLPDTGLTTNPLTQNDYVLDDSLTAQQTSADGITSLVSLLSNSSTPGSAGVNLYGNSSDVMGNVVGDALQQYDMKQAGDSLKGPSWLQTTMKNVGLGMGAGDLFGSLIQGGDSGTHQIWGQLGGAIGGLFGPTGGILGALFGSLFGHTNNPQNMPDQYGIPGIGMTAQGYQQYLGTFNGGAGDVLQQLQAFIRGGGAAAGNPQQQALFNELKGWMGNNPNGLAIASEKNGIFTLASGMQVGVQQFIQATTQAQNVMQGLEANKITAEENAQRLADSFLTRALNAPAGFQMSYALGGGGGALGGPTMTPLPTGPRLPLPLVPTVGTTIPGGPQRIMPHTAPVIHILENAHISADMEHEVMQAIPRLRQALADAVNEANYMEGRNMSGYVPAL